MSDIMLQKPKGTYDIYGDDAKRILYLKKLVVALMDKYNFNYIETPIFESSELFHRGVGETSDIVSKETYDFKDRGERLLTLRPEGTAGVVRAYIENKLYTALMPYKAWYFGPMFRYERPQAGRNRQFTQFGVEVFGSEDALVDAEVISVLVNFFSLLGLKGIKVNINTLGDSESRDNYRSALLEYFRPHLDNLCDDCKKRFEKNPLRILDCKIDGQSDIMKYAPKIQDYLNDVSIEHFEKVKEYLKSLNIQFVINDNLVRGLDYYTHTVFEVEADIKGFGAQNVLGAGGRYNNLVETLGGPKNSGVGFAIGIDRLLLALKASNIDILDNNTIDAYVFSLDDAQKAYCLKISNMLRINGFNIDSDLIGRNMKNNFKRADKLGAKFVIFAGSLEEEENIVTIKNNKTQEEYKVKVDKLIEFLDQKIDDE